MTSIIRIKYAIPIRNKEEDTQVEEIDGEILVNIDCPLKLILNYIRNVVGLDDTTEFDLCDEINCHLRKVSFFGPYTPGFEVFQADLTYLIVTFQRDENGQMTNITPLLTGKAAKRCNDIILRSQALSKKHSSVRLSVKKVYVTDHLYEKIVFYVPNLRKVCVVG